VPAPELFGERASVLNLWEIAFRDVACVTASLVDFGHRRKVLQMVVGEMEIRFRQQPGGNCLCHLESELLLGIALKRLRYCLSHINAPFAFSVAADR